MSRIGVVWREHRLRVVVAGIGLCGLVAVVLLLLLPPSVVYGEPDPVGGVGEPGPPAVVRCHGVLTPIAPGAGRWGDGSTDVELNGFSPYASPAFAVTVANVCERRRGHRQAWALLIAVPASLMLAGTLFGRRGGSARMSDPLRSDEPGRYE
jgi:hypothetical protein